MRSQLSFVAACVVFAVGCSAADTGNPAPQKGSSNHSGSTDPGGSTNTGGSTDTGSGNDNGATTPPSTGGPSTTPPTGTTPSNTIAKDETWAAGKQITGSVLIAPGVTVTIAPAATVTIADGAVITIGGTLKAAATSGHAKLAGTAWGGIVVESGGTLSLDGVDMQNPTTAIAAKGGNTAATYANGTITAPGTPFSIDVGGKLSFSHAMVVGAKGMSSVGGTLTASYLDYDSGGNEGIVATDASAVFTIDDSKLHGTGNTSGDMIVANNAATVHIAHSEISKVHCAFHFNAITSFDVSFMNVHDDSYGFMMYGSSAAAGKRTVDSSNFTTLSVGIDESGTNGLTNVTGCYFSGVATVAHLVDTQVKVVGTVKTTVPGAGPRP